MLADTEADAANDSVRGNLRVLSVLATWGPPTSNHEAAHASRSFPADQPLEHPTDDFPLKKFRNSFTRTNLSFPRRKFSDQIFVDGKKAVRQRGIKQDAR